LCLRCRALGGNEVSGSDGRWNERVVSRDSDGPGRTGDSSGGVSIKCIEVCRVVCAVATRGDLRNGWVVFRDIGGASGKSLGLDINDDGP